MDAARATFPIPYSSYYHGGRERRGGQRENRLCMAPKKEEEAAGKKGEKSVKVLTRSAKEEEEERGRGKSSSVAKAWISSLFSLFLLPSAWTLSGRGFFVSAVPVVRSEGWNGNGMMGRGPFA